MTWFYWFFYRFWSGLTGFPSVEPSFTGFYLVLTGLRDKMAAEEQLRPVGRPDGNRRRQLRPATSPSDGKNTLAEIIRTTFFFLKKKQKKREKNDERK